MRKMQVARLGMLRWLANECNRLLGTVDNGYNATMQKAGPVSFLLHAAVAMVIAPIAAMAVALGAVIVFNNSHGINSLLNAGGAANPFLWGPGLLLGLLVNRFALRRTACWVWLAGIVWMACGIIAALSSYHARFAGICSPLDSIMNGFFFSKQPYCGDPENLMLFTLPTLSAIAYSLGAWVTLWLVRRQTLPWSSQAVIGVNIPITLRSRSGASRPNRRAAQKHPTIDFHSGES